jgi:hypothetical protein
VLSEFDRAGALAMVKVQTASAPQGRFTKDQFVIVIVVRTVTCPNRVTVPDSYGPEPPSTCSASPCSVLAAACRWMGGCGC